MWVRPPRFQLIPYHSYSYVANHLNILLSRKQKFTQIVLTKKTLRFVRCLHNFSVIKNYIILEKLYKKRLIKCIRFNGAFFKNESYFRGIRVVSTPSRKHTITLKGLHLMNKSIGKSVVILETSMGLISHTKAIEFGIGGLILCVIG